jgi:hypothetical protein
MTSVAAASHTLSGGVTTGATMIARPTICTTHTALRRRLGGNGCSSHGHAHAAATNA